MAKEVPLMASAESQQGEGLSEKSISVKRGKVDSITLYEVTSDELDVLGSGSPSDLQLNFGISLLSSASSFLVSLLTTDVKSDRLFTVLTVVTTIGAIVGCVLLGLWWRTRKAGQKIIEQIKSRTPS
jgi:hypothetical protein